MKAWVQRGRWRGERGAVTRITNVSGILGELGRAWVGVLGAWVWGRSRAFRVYGTALVAYETRSRRTPPPSARSADTASMSQYHFFRLMLVRRKAYYLRVYLLRVLYARRRHSNIWEHEGNHSTCRRISCTLVLTGYPWVASVIQESGHNTISVSLVRICTVVRIKSMIALGEHTHIS